MTVKELEQILSQYPEEMEVYIAYDDPEHGAEGAFPADAVYQEDGYLYISDYYEY